MPLGFREQLHVVLSGVTESVASVAKCSHSAKRPAREPRPCEQLEKRPKIEQPTPVLDPKERFDLPLKQEAALVLASVAGVANVAGHLGSGTLLSDALVAEARAADWRDAFEERAAILEYDQGYSRTEAERIALELLTDRRSHRARSW